MVFCKFIGFSGIWDRSSRFQILDRAQPSRPDRISYSGQPTRQIGTQDRFCGHRLMKYDVLKQNIMLGMMDTAQMSSRKIWIWVGAGGTGSGAGGTVFGAGGDGLWSISILTGNWRLHRREPSGHAGVYTDRKYRYGTLNFCSHPWGSGSL